MKYKDSGNVDGTVFTLVINIHIIELYSIYIM